jgi:O-antigen ligase
MRIFVITITFYSFKLPAAKIEKIMLGTLKNNVRVFHWLVCILFVGMLFPQVRMSNIPLALLLLFCLVHASPMQIWTTLKSNRFALLLLGIFLLQVIGLLYTENEKDGFFILEKKLCFILMPVFIFPFAARLSRAQQHKLLETLGLIMILSSAILLLIGLYRKFVLGYEHAFFFESFREFEGFTPIHYVYYALYFACGFLIFMDGIYDRLVVRKYGYIFIALLFIYGLSMIMLIASKMGIFVFVISTAVFLYRKTVNKKHFAIGIVSLSICLVVLFLLNDTTRARFAELADNLDVVKQSVFVEDFKWTGLNMRLLFWKISLVHLWQDNLVLTGVGTGDGKDYINSIFNLPQYEFWGYLNWDSHNQWVFTLIQVGVAGVLILALIYIAMFRKAFAMKDFKLLAFAIVTLGFSMTESILDLNKGIIFFTLFLTLLTAPEKSEQPMAGVS